MSFTIPDNAILSRRINYHCCVADKLNSFLNDKKWGERACHEDAIYLMKWMQWAASIMDRSPISTETGCVDPVITCKVMQWADAICSKCACCPPFYEQDPCVLTPFMQVMSAEDANQQDALLPNMGKQYLIVSNVDPVSNDWSTRIGDVATTNGSTWQYITPPSGALVGTISSANLWITYPGGVGPQYPDIDGEIGGSTITLTSSSPGVSAVGGRSVVVQVSIDGSSWDTVYVGSETALINPVVVPLATVNPTLIRSFYYNNQCSYGPFPGTINTAEGRSFEFLTDDFGGQEGALGPGVISVTPNSVPDLYQIPEWTIAAYVKCTNPLGFYYFLYAITTSIQNRTNVYLTSAPNSVIFECPSGNMLTWNVDVTDGNWHHIAFVKTGAVNQLGGTNMSLYVDGVFVDQAYLVPSAGGNDLPFNKLYIYYGILSAGIPPYSGAMRMAEIYMCASARSQADIQNFLVTGAVDGNDGSWNRSMYIKPSPSDVAGINTVQLNNPTNDTYSYNGLFAADGPL